ncbi:hypothetical protein [Streptomyces otsuchiensis]|uniref:hypothetical protein n=1 Tax=Streptomyces otsuchiensis TaxID=2681388 RepID=UPI00102FA366|nr:hypothetical protein [Streptomyces otsuchiensis]
MRTSADPVHALLHRHREICERAVDPLEIAALLEARGVTDRTAARFRHRDVFSLAEELYARVPRPEEATAAPVTTPEPPAARRACVRAVARAALTLSPAALCAATLAAVAGLPRLPGVPGGATTVTVVGVGGALLALLALGLLLRRRVPAGGGLAALSALLLAGYALVGDALLSEMARRPPSGGADTVRTAALAALALSVAAGPALWTADWFGRRARLRLIRSRSLRELAANTRPLLAAAVSGFAVALLAAQGGVWALSHLSRGTPAPWPAPDAGQVVAFTAVGLLLHLALLLLAHGHRDAATGALATVSVTLLLAVSVVGASWLPGLRAIGLPVEYALGLGGPPLLPAVLAGAVWLVLLVYAARTLTGPWAHHSAPVAPAGTARGGPSAARRTPPEARGTRAPLRATHGAARWTAGSADCGHGADATTGDPADDEGPAPYGPPPGGSRPGRAGADRPGGDGRAHPGHPADVM